MTWEDRNPATRPSSHAERSIVRATREPSAWPWFVTPFVAVLILLAILVAFSGCSTTKDEQALVIEEGVILLETHSHPELPKWEARRIQFLADAAPYRPAPSPSPSPAGGK